MIRLGSVADDLTGATTAAALLARSGISAIAYWDLDKAEDSLPSDAEAVLLSTASRAMKPSDAYQTVKKATQILRRMGAGKYQKRIDTTLRGDIGTEIDAMLDVLGDDYLAVVVPSMPQNHRIVLGGYSLIDGDLLSRTEVRNDARTPVNESFVPRLLAGQSVRRIAQITAESLTAGMDAVAERLRQLYASGIRIVVVDAVLLDDIKLIAGACQKSGLPILSVDPGPFTASLLNANSAAAVQQRQETGERTGTVLVAVGSTTQTSRRQIDVLCKNRYNVRIPLHTERFLHDREERAAEINRAVDETVGLLRQEDRPHAIVLDASSGAAGFSKAEVDLRDIAREREGRDPVGDSLGIILKQILEQPERDSVSGLYMTGGDTMAAILMHLNGACIRVHDYIVPQVDLCRLYGGPLDGMMVVSKGGLVGDDQTAVNIVRKMRQEAAREGLSFH